MATRQYRRDSQGRFAGSSDPGAKVTTGRAGGFANATFRARVANNRASKKRRQALVRRGVETATAAAVVGAASAIGRKSVRKRPAGDVTQTVRRAVQPIVRTIRQ